MSYDFNWNNWNNWNRNTFFFFPCYCHSRNFMSCLWNLTLISSGEYLNGRIGMVSLLADKSFGRVIGKVRCCTSLMMTRICGKLLRWTISLLARLLDIRTSQKSIEHEYHTTFILFMCHRDRELTSIVTVIGA